MPPARLVRLGTVLAAAALITGGTGVPSSAHSARSLLVDVEDRCDVATFNEAIGPGTCVDNGQNQVTFAKFLKKLTSGGHNHWAFDPEKRTIDHGDTVAAQNVGGEFHTFTEVSRFGQGCVPELNAAVPNEPPAQIRGAEACAQLGEPAVMATFLPSGATLRTEALSPGVHRFECLIHPWMRTTITVEHD